MSDSERVRDGSSLTKKDVKDVDELRELVLSFGSGEGADDAVPLDLMIKSLAELQKVASQLSSYYRKHNSGHANRTTVPKSSYELNCKGLVPGCVNVLVEVGPTADCIQNRDQLNHVGQFRKTFHQTIECANGRDLTKLEDVVEDPYYRASITTSLQALEGLQRRLPVEIKNARRQKLYDGTKMRELKLTPKPNTKKVAATKLDETLFAGFLNNIGVKKSELRLDLLAGGSLMVPYNDSFAALNIEVDPDKLVQVSGEGEVGSPRSTPKLTKLDWICPVDESDMTLNAFKVDRQEYVADPPLRYNVEFDREEEFYVVTGDLDIQFAVDTRADAETRLESEVAFTWIDIAQEKDMNRLSDRAKTVRTEMLRRVQRSK